MPTYEVNIDFAKDWNQKNIHVEQIEMEAENAEHANEIAPDYVQSLIASGDLPNMLFYVWEITEDDAIQKEIFMITYEYLHELRTLLAKRFEELNMHAAGDNIVNVYYACDEMLQHLMFFARLENQHLISEEKLKEIAKLVLSDNNDA